MNTFARKPLSLSEVVSICVRWAGWFVADVGRGVSVYARF